MSQAVTARRVSGWMRSDPASDLAMRVAAVTSSRTMASFTFNCTNLACSFDASASSDSDGSIVSYAWDFGDGGSGTGVTTSHSYAAGGTFSVTLTVTDDSGATVDIIRNGVKIKTTNNDGSYTDRPSNGTWTYEVCQQNSSVCSNMATVTK